MPCGQTLPEEIRIGTQSRHLHSSNTREVSVPAGNSKQVLKLVKLLNGKGASTILVINHDGKRMFVMKMNRRQMLSIISFTAASTLLFHLCHLRKEAVMNWNYISDFKA